MIYLLDTHTLLWYLSKNERLSKNAMQIIDAGECLYSIASLWEIAIKKSINKIRLDVSIQEFSDICKRENFYLLQILPNHIETLSNLPFIHRDPFDRLLISQAITENLTFITKDKIIPKYDVTTIW